MTRCLMVAWLLCAWVLWNESPTVFRQAGMRVVELMIIVDAFETKAKCDAEATAHAKDREAENRADKAYTKVTRKGTWVFWESDVALGSDRYRCLPSGTDPRPRGKE